MINIPFFRQKLLDILQDILGTYTLPNGDIYPAISVDDRGIWPPEDTVIEGLECYVVPLIESPITPLIQSKHWDYVSEIQLKQWSKTGTTLEATSLIGAHFDQLEIGPRVLPLKELGNIETRTIRIVHSLIKRKVINGNSN